MIQIERYVEMKALVVILCVVVVASSEVHKSLIKDLQRPYSKIIGGQIATRDQFPYIGSIQYDLLVKQHLCGGALITENWILTAAHCDVGFGYYSVILGNILIEPATGSTQEIAISDRILHEGFSGEISANDIAVFKLVTPAVLTASVALIKLPQAGVEPSGDAIFAGWGYIDPDAIKTSNELFYTPMNIITFEECDAAVTGLLGDSDPLNRDMVCTGPTSGGVASCGGDSGGPLAQNGFVVGIASWGINPCGHPGAPSIHTKCSSFIDWITQKIGVIP